MSTIEGSAERAVPSAEGAAGVGEVCKNCGAELTGPWCGACGQKHLAGPPTVGLFLEELISAVTHADSRFWRTLWALIAKPGFLAREFFDGRRARYLPPLRLYLGLSLVFFLYLSADSQFRRSELSAPDDIQPAPTFEEKAKSALDQRLPPDARDRVAAVLEQTTDPDLDALDDDDICQFDDKMDLPEFLRPRVESTCRSVQSDGGYALAQSFIAKLPTAMFVLMPLFAAVMKLWYWRPKRYFTEHLVLQINNHSAIFLFALLANLLSVVVGEALSGLITIGIAIYIVVYSYRSLGVFYQQGKWLTRFKYFSLMLVYQVLVALVLGFTGMASLFSVAAVR